jgi:hypothetical protein
MSKTLEKCKCGNELAECGLRYVSNAMSQEFVCLECWVKAKSKKKKPFKKCCRCGKVLGGVNFIDHRYCSTYDSTGKSKFNMVCTECEPYSKMGDRH